MPRAALGLGSPLLRGSPTQSASRQAWIGLRRWMFSGKTTQGTFANIKMAQDHHATVGLLSKLRDWRCGNRAGSMFARMQQRGFRSSAWRRNTTQIGPQEKLTLRQKLKRLSKEYGWSAVGVYLALSVLDFPFCFLLVRFLGVETIGAAEHYVVSSVKQFIPESVRQKWREYWQSVKEAETDAAGENGISDKVEMAGWGVKKAQEQHAEEASLGTQLALAYAIHKSFIFLRVPLTAAVTPRFVQMMRSWGWNLGKRGSR